MTSEISTIDDEQQTLPTGLNDLFAQLNPQDVELFYQGYRLWTIQHDIVAVQSQIAELQRQIEHNAELMQSIQPSPIALSVLAQLQAYNVSDIDLLDRMLERGESWLDHTMQLLARCEQLDVIRGDYTQWCENSLEGAYGWIDSMDAAPKVSAIIEPFDENMETTLLQKLMSEDDSESRLAPIKADPTHGVNQDDPILCKPATPASAETQAISAPSSLLAALPETTETTTSDEDVSEKLPAAPLEHSAQPPQATITRQELAILQNEPIRPPQSLQKKRRNLLERLLGKLGRKKRKR